MGVNVVKYGGRTLIDLTDSTVSEDTLLDGVTAYNSKGELITGTYTPLSKISRYAVLPASGWIEDLEEYNWRWYQTVTVNGILETDEPLIDLYLNGLTEAEEDAVAEGWAYMVKIVTSANAITAYACDLPDVDIPIKIKEVR